MWCSFSLKGLFDTQKEGYHVANYNEKGNFDNFMWWGQFFINVVINFSLCNCVSDSMHWSSYDFFPDAGPERKNW